MNKYLSAVAISACLCTLAAAQSPISPYSLFGIGSIDNSSHGAYTGMGGIGTGLRESNVLNTANPASLTAMKKQTFVLDLAARGGQWCPKRSVPLLSRISRPLSEPAFHTLPER